MAARLLAVSLMAASLFGAAPVNQLTITDETSGVQTNRPTRFGRPFAKGEIFGWPKPVIDGTPVTSWQATVKTRHRDGLASCAVEGATNEYPITVSCPNHGYRTGDWITISGVLGNTAANGRHRIVRRGRHTFFLQGASGSGAYSSGGTAVGPGPGSVQFAIIVIDQEVDLSADGSVTVTFQDSSNACHLGSEATCEAAALTEAQMLAWDSAGWGAEIEATQGNTYTANARTMVDAAHFEYYVAGPILTEVIVRDHSTARTYDFGWTCTGSCTTDYSPATWSTDATDRSLSPIFVLGFYDALPNSVRIEYILENPWYGHLQDQRYSLALNSDSTGSTSEYTKAATTHYARQRWRYVAWDGVEPGAVNIDHNKAYWGHSGATPVWATDVEPAAADITAELTGSCLGIAGFCDCTSSITYNPLDKGCIHWGSAGGDHEGIGVFPKWDSLWIQTQDYTMWPLVYGNGTSAGTPPIHVREASEDTTLYFIDVDADGSTDNDADDNEAENSVFGRIYSVDAHPTGNAVSGGNVATLSGSHGWSNDFAHQTGIAFTAYLATGEWYLLEELQMWAAHNVSNLDSGYSGCGRNRNFSWVNGCIQTRGIGWSMRTVLHAAWASSDGSGEKEYFTNRVEWNMMTNEGAFESHFHGIHYLPLIGQTDAAPCTGQSDGALWTANNPYCYGRRFGNNTGNYLNNPLGAPTGGAGTGCDSYTQGTLCDGGFMEDYMLVGFYGRAKDLGFRSEDLLRMTAKWRFQFWHEDHNIYVAFGYRIPVWLNTTGRWPVSPKQHYTDGYTASGKALDAWTSFTVFTPQNYQIPFTRGVLPYMKEGRLGNINFDYVWDWLTNETNLENTTTRCIAGTLGAGCTTSLVHVRWNFYPRFDPTSDAKVTPGHTYSIWRWKAPRPESACTVDGNADGQTGLKYREYVLTGLTASTEYNHVLSCTYDPWGSETVNYTTTAAPSSTADLTVRVGAGDTTTYLDWGYTSSLTETPDSAACTTGCELSVTANKGLVYYRVRHADGRTGSTTMRNLQ